LHVVYSNARIQDWSEYSQDNANLVLAKLRREIGPSALAAKLNKPWGSAASLDVDLEEEHFCAEPVAVETTDEEVRAPAPTDDVEAAEIEATAHFVQPDTEARRHQAGPGNYSPARRQTSPVHRQDSCFHVPASVLLSSFVPRLRT
jgi:hypothetical protein